jgi:hypothetical protein
MRHETGRSLLRSREVMNMRLQPRAPPRILSPSTVKRQLQPANILLTKFPNTRRDAFQEGFLLPRALTTLKQFWMACRCEFFKDLK